MPDIRKQLRKAIEKHGREWSEIQPAWLGDLAGTVVSGTAGVYFARLANGKVIRVHNTFGAPPTFDLHVKIGRTRNLSKIWQIIQVVEDYDTSAAAGEIAYHSEQHEFGHGDELQANAKHFAEEKVHGERQQECERHKLRGPGRARRRGLRPSTGLRKAARLYANAAARAGGRAAPRLLDKS